MNAIRLYFLRKSLIERSVAHRAGYYWALSQLRIGVEADYVEEQCDGYLARAGKPDAFDCGVFDAVRDFARANHDAR